jgi:alpha-beta hydrolase superfamily lysophospholipase
MAEEAHFPGYDGKELYRRTWPVDAPDAPALIIVHGFGEHCARYDGLAQELNETGFSVYSYDHRYHGRSPGKRGMILDFEHLVKDLDAFLEHIHARLEGRDVMILGHSMGGLVLATRLERGPLPVKAAIFSSPFLQLEDVSPFLAALSGVLSAVVPWLPVAKLSTRAISRDPEEVAAYETDPLVHHGSIKVRTGAEFQRSVAAARAGFERIDLPIYIIHGERDALVPPEGSKLLFERAHSEDKQLKIYDGGYHELFNDTCREEVLHDLREWLAKQLGSH